MADFAKRIHEQWALAKKSSGVRSGDKSLSEILRFEFFLQTSPPEILIEKLGYTFPRKRKP